MSTSFTFDPCEAWEIDVAAVEWELLEIELGRVFALVFELPDDPIPAEVEDDSPDDEELEVDDPFALDLVAERAMTFELPVEVMIAEIETGPALEFDLIPAALVEDPLEVDVLVAVAMEVDMLADEAMTVAVCWPPIVLDYVTVDGVVVTVNGDPVYVLLEV